MDLNDLIITKVKDVTMYKTSCPDCGWKNSLDVMAHYCLKCGKDLYVMTLAEIGNSFDSDECIGDVDLSTL